MDIPDISYLLFQTQALETFQVYFFVYVNRRGRLYLHFVGKGMVRPYLRIDADSEKLHRHTAGTREEWVWLGNNQLHYSCERRRN